MTKKPYRPPAVKSVQLPPVDRQRMSLDLMDLSELMKHINRLHNDAGIEPVKWESAE